MAETGEALATTVVARCRRSTTDELLAEALALAERLRQVVLEPAPELAHAARLQLVAKQGELVSLIGFCVAWLYARKAVETGELDAEEARDEAWRLGAIAPVAVDLAAIGPEAHSLAELDAAVRGLHERLGRLDRLLDPVVPDPQLRDA